MSRGGLLCCPRPVSPWTMHLLLLTLLAIIKQGMCIGCFYCVSRNNSDPTCGDPFDPAYSEYRPHCKTGKRNRVGLMPAQFCIKIVGTPVHSDEELMIRTCSLRNMDSQCGQFQFEDGPDAERQLLQGCILTCDFDGCNGAAPATPVLWRAAATALLASLLAALSTGTALPHPPPP